MKLMFETMSAGAERGISYPGTLRGVRPVGPTEIDELKLFQDRATLNLGYEERRGAQAIGEAALHVLCRLSISGDGGARHTQQQVAEWKWRSVANAGLVLTAHHSDDADAPGLLVAVTIDHPLRDALFAPRPVQFREIDANGIEPGRLARGVAIMALLDIAGSASPEVGNSPTFAAPWNGQAEMLPCSAVGRMLDDATPCRDSLQGSSKATAVITKLELMGLAGAAVPEPAPPLAGWMRHDRMRSGVVAGITIDVPRIDARQAEIAAVRFDVEGGDGLHLPTLPRHNTSELKIAVIADLPAADLAGGHVVQPADAEVDFQAVGERVREASAATVECLPKALQFGEGGGHATACFGWRF